MNNNQLFKPAPQTPSIGNSPSEAAQASPPVRPDTYRLPSKGGDPFFGLTRSWYYAAESAGFLRLVRLRQRGKVRGVVLVPYLDVAALVRAAQAESSPSSSAQ